MKPHPIPENELHAWLDGQLPAARSDEVAAWLAGNPDAAGRLASYREQTEALHQSFDAVLDEPLPAALRRLAEPPTVPAGWRNFLPPNSLQRLAAGCLIALLGAAGGWLGRGHYAEGGAAATLAALPRQAAVAHAVYTPDVRRPVEVGAEQEEQLVKWLSKRLGVTVKPPHLGGIGYELVGGRLLPGGNGPVAQFMYQDAAGQRLTLYLTPDMANGRDTAFRFAQEGALNVFYWVDGRFGYALSAGIPRSELAKLASAVYEQLELRK